MRRKNNMTSRLDVGLEEYDDIKSALFELFEVWANPAFQFNTAELTEDTLKRSAYKFFVLNMYACHQYQIEPEEFIRHWNKVK